MDNYDPDVAKFDMSFSTLGRINFWLWKCDEASFEDDIISWFRSVKVVYKECHAFMKPDELIKFSKFLSDTEESYSEYLQYLKEVNIYKNKMANHPPPRKVFDDLLKWELELRLILDKKGLLMQRTADAREAMI